MEKREKTQQESIIEYVKLHGSITPIEALNLCGCFRLAAQIYELKRKKHFNFKTLSIPKPDNTGFYAKYVLE